MQQDILNEFGLKITRDGDKYEYTNSSSDPAVVLLGADKDGKSSVVRLEPGESEKISFAAVDSSAVGVFSLVKKETGRGGYEAQQDGPIPVPVLWKQFVERGVVQKDESCAGHATRWL